MDSHTKPYICPYVDCKRNSEGFSRRDNLNIHLKSHRSGNRKKHRRIRSPGAADGSGGELRRIEKKAQRDKLRLMLKTTKALLRQMEEEEEEEEGDTSSEGIDEFDNEVAENSRDEK
jgi:hypothetical protein